MIQAEVFNVGDQARTYDSSALLVIRDIAIHRGRTTYLVEETETMFGKTMGAWWAMHDELQPPEGS